MQGNQVQGNHRGYYHRGQYHHRGGPGRGYPNAHQQHAPRYTAQYDNYKKPISILVIGPHGSGKSAFVNTVIGRPDWNENPNIDPCSRRTPKNWVGSQEFRFIEPQGFDNPELSDWYILETMLQTFCPPKPSNYDNQPYRPSEPEQVLTGILYIHPDDDCQAGRTSLQTLRTLVGLLGESYLERVTVLIQSRTEASALAVDPSLVSSFSTNPDSPLHAFYAVKPDHRPATVSFTLNLQLIETILYRFTQKQPEPFFAQQKLIDGSWKYIMLHSNLRDFVSGKVDYLPVPDQPSTLLLQQKDEALQELRKSTREQLEQLNESLGKRNEELEQLRKSSQETDAELLKAYKASNARAEEVEKLKQTILEKEAELEKLRTSSEAQDTKLKELERSANEKDQELEKLRRSKQDKDNKIGTPKSSNGISKLESAYKDEIQSLNSKLHRISGEYASIRAQVQIQENVEQFQVTQALKDINRLIDELGESISNHLVDNYPKPTASLHKAFQTRELLETLGHTGKSSPQVKVWVQAPLDPEDFFYYVVRATLCYQLYRRLFEPFHPSIVRDEQKHELISDLYTKILYRESQLAVGRWRKDSFNSISASISQSHGSSIYLALLDSLRSVLGAYFDSPAEVKLNEEHETMLRKLVDMAERWNQLLKGDIVLLGEFQPIAYPCGNSFKANFMTESEAAKWNGAEHSQAKSILGTVGLGLIKSRAVGGNKEPEEEIVHKATVVSEKWFG